jgi:thiamine pyrophosphate-dependent acetolactate synthase large subunit-like protein
LGSRLDVRQTGADTAAFVAGRSIIHVDCEPGEINNRLTGCSAVVATLPEFLEAAIEMASRRSFPERNAWRAQIEEWKVQWPDTAELAGVSGINPNVFMHRLSAQSQPAGTYVIDVGQHQMWAAQSIDVRHDQRFLTSGGMGSMGFALLAAIGAALSTDRPVDAGFSPTLGAIDYCLRLRDRKLPTVFMPYSELMTSTMTARFGAAATRSLTLGALIRAPTVREGLPPTAQYHAVRDLAGVSHDAKAKAGYPLQDE